MHNFLFELGTEEIPTLEIESLLTQLKEGFVNRLREEQVDYKRLESYATNRRFTLFISGIAVKARDKKNFIQGPPQKIAFNAKNQPTLALKKFLESRKIKLSDTRITRTPKGPYVTCEETIKGKPARDILQTIIPRILGAIKFDRAMVWNPSRVPFIRPIKNLLVLLNRELIELEFAGISSSRTIRGHALLSEKPIQIESFKHYIEELQKNFVILGTHERKEKIEKEIQEYEHELDLICEPVEDLLYYHLYNNEYPVVFCGEFSPEYLTLPNEIISAFMINEKKLFPCRDRKGKLKNMFIGVSNVPDENEYVASGNNKIIRATFEDARFFWQKDTEKDFLKLRDQLRDILFHKEAGNFYDKTERLRDISLALLKELNFDPALKTPLATAALNCKNDLATQMVGEFPSLQGVMGGLYYQQAFGKDHPEIYQAMYHHYQPRGFVDCPDFPPTGIILALADKIDNITSLIPRGIKVTGSKDPYGLRRDGNAILKIMIDFQLDLDLISIIDFCLKKTGQTRPEHREKVVSFFRSRIESCFKDILQFRYDIVDGVLDVSSLDVSDIYQKTRQLSEIRDQESMRILVSLHKRTRNILKNLPRRKPDPDLLTENAEKILYEILTKSGERIHKSLKEKKYISACSKIIEMKPVIDRFFDEILVMAKEPKIRNARVALVQMLDQQLTRVANFTLITE